MKKIEKRFDERICVEVFYIDDEGYKVGVNIFPIQEYGSFGSRLKEFGINWSAHGTVDVTTAKNYSHLIDVAIEECEKNNSLID